MEVVKNKVVQRDNEAVIGIIDFWIIREAVVEVRVTNIVVPKSITLNKNVVRVTVLGVNKNVL